MLREPGAQLAKRRVLTRRDKVIASEPEIGNDFLRLSEVVDAMQRSNLAEERDGERVVEDAWWEGGGETRGPEHALRGKTGSGNGIYGEICQWLDITRRTTTHHPSHCKRTNRRR